MYNEKYLKTKIKFYDGRINTNFHQNKTQKKKQQTNKLYGPFSWMGFNCLKPTEPEKAESILSTHGICLSTILIDSIVQIDKTTIYKYYWNSVITLKRIR